MSLKIIRYLTVNECLASHFNCKISELEGVEGYWEWEDADGTYHRWEVQESMRVIRKRAVWGWTENKKIIHCFIRSRASFRQVMRLISHEIGHTYRPFHRGTREERKANKYADVASCAYDISKRICLKMGINPLGRQPGKIIIKS